MNVEKSFAYWATIQLYRAYLFTDGPVMETIRDAGNTMNISALSKIADSYSVARTIPAAPKNENGQGGDYNYILFLKALLNLRAKWPSGTLNRACACRETANELAKNFKRKPQDEGQNKNYGAPHSAVTKLIWFLEPKGWTIYDQIVANAVLKGGGNTEDRQRRFYETIDQPFAKYSKMIRPVLSTFNSKLHAERLVDMYLQFTGYKDDARDKAMKRNRYFLKLLPKEIGKQLKTNGAEIAQILPNDAFGKEAHRS